MDERIDVVDGVFGKPAIGREAVGAMSLCHVAIVEAGGIHSLPATLAAAAAGVDFDRDAIAVASFADEREQQLENRREEFLDVCRDHVAHRRARRRDPAPDVPLFSVVAAAKELRGRLEQIGLVTFCKTTGGKGLHMSASPPRSPRPRSPR